jgi:stress-induced morphogen
VIGSDALTGLIRARLPDAEVGISDRTGTMDHFNVIVRSKAFRGKTLLEQHRLVYGALQDALADGRVHAVELKTVVVEDEQNGF